MLYKFLALYGTENLFFNLFRYITLRSGGALLTSLLISLLIGPWMIKYLKSKQGKGQPIRDDGPTSHMKTKKGTPTMGGFLILISLTSSILLWADLSNAYIWITLLTTLFFGLLGFSDDYLKVTQQTSKGISAKTKLLAQLIVSFIAVGAIMYFLPENLNSSLAFPFFKNMLLPLGWLFIPFSIVVIVGSSNAVNLTDGLDGLAIGPIIVASLCFLIITYVTGNYHFSAYLQLHYVPGSGELAVFCGALIGAGLGFLWFNTPPASIFMGDMGSLAMGGALGTMSIIVKNELVWIIIGGLFVMETASVIIQVTYFKLTGGKRIFLMAPIHHHFEKKGWAETTIVIRFWIISVVLAMVGLATLKLR